MLRAGCECVRNLPQAGENSIDKFHNIVKIFVIIDLEFAGGKEVSAKIRKRSVFFSLPLNSLAGQPGFR
jgi:hypothetical protein